MVFLRRASASAKRSSLASFVFCESSASLAFGDIIELDIAQFGAHLMGFGPNLEATLQVFFCGARTVSFLSFSA